MTCSGFAPTGPCPSYAGDPRTGHSTLGWVSPEWSRGEQSPSLTASYSLHYFHTDSWWGHLIQSWPRSHCNKFSDKQMLEQCLKKVKNTLQVIPWWDQQSPPFSVPSSPQCSMWCWESIWPYSSFFHSGVSLFLLSRMLLLILHCCERQAGWGLLTTQCVFLPVTRSLKKMRLLWEGQITQLPTVG